MELSVLKPGSESAGTVSVSDTTFAREYNEALVHQVVTAYLAGARQGSRAQKTRSDVSGGGYFEMDETQDLSATFVRVAEELHRQYWLGFAPRKLDGKTHEIEVKVRRRGLDVRARQITENMKLRAAEAIAAAVSKNELSPEYIIPSVFHPTVFKNVAKCVAEAAIADGVAEPERKAIATFI